MTLCLYSLYVDGCFCPAQHLFSLCITASLSLSLSLSLSQKTNCQLLSQLYLLKKQLYSRVLWLVSKKARIKYVVIGK